MGVLACQLAGAAAGTVLVIDKKSVHVRLLLVRDPIDLAQAALEGIAKAELADDLMGHDRVDVVGPEAEEIRLLAIILGHPPAMVFVHDARLDRVGHVSHRLDTSDPVLDPDPLSIRDAELGSCLGIDLDGRPGIDLA